MLVPPGGDLIACVYACWRIGATVVVTDAGLGVRGIHRALRGAAPKHVIGIPKAMALVRALRLPGQRISVGQLPEIARNGSGAPLPDAPHDDDVAVIVFTSGSTGPAKGVVYLHRQVQVTRDLLIAHYGITDSDSLVAAFAPWAVLGPAIGISSSLPDMDVTSPRTLEASALADAVRVVDGTLLWASPAAFTNVLATSRELDAEQRASFESLRLVLGAGAPVSSALLHGMGDLCTNAEVRTPYGMTEALPVCDVTVGEIDAAGPGDGVLVGRPLPGVRVRISEVDADGRASGPLSDSPDVLGEIVVSGPHLKERYDRLWATQRASARDAGWHRTGDIGHLDGDGPVVDRRTSGARHHHARGPARSGRRRAARSSAWTECATRPASVSGRSARRHASSLSSQTIRATGWRTSSSRRQSGAQAGVPVAAVIERRGTAGRHPTQLEGRSCRLGRDREPHARRPRDPRE